jgi:hypothetical protein
MRLEGAPETIPPWERSLRDLTEIIRKGMTHLGNAEAAIVRTGDPQSAAVHLNEATACDRQARKRMVSFTELLAVPNQERLVARAASKSTSEVLMQSFLLYRMSVELIIRVRGLDVRDLCIRALRIAKEFARSSMLLIREAPAFEQQHMLGAVQSLNTLRRDFDERFVPVFDRITDVYGRLAPEEASGLTIS